MPRDNVIQKQSFWDVLENIKIENIADLKYLLKKRVIVEDDIVSPSGKFIINHLIKTIEESKLEIYFEDSHYHTMIGTCDQNMGKYSRGPYISLIMCDRKMNLEQRKIWIEFTKKARPDECDLCTNIEELSLINKEEWEPNSVIHNKRPFKTIEDANEALLGPRYIMEGMESTILPEGMRLWWD